MQIRGATGEIRWAYLPAVVFGPWRLDTFDGGARLEAAIVSVDDYRREQEPLMALLYVGRQTLAFPVTSLTVTGQQLGAELGPQQRKDPR